MPDLPKRSVDRMLKEQRIRLFGLDPRSPRGSSPEQKEADRLRSSMRWQRLRDRVLQREPLCRLCYRKGLVVMAAEVDHIEPIRDAPERAFDVNNLQPLCKRCHIRKSGEERKERNRRARNDGGNDQRV